MKYKYGDILYYRPSYSKTGYEPLQVINYDESKKMYFCFVFDMSLEVDYWHLAYIKEDELGLLSEINELEDYYKSKSGEPIVPYNIDKYSFKIYIYDNNKMTLVQKEIRKRKNKFDIPTRRNKK